MDLRGLGWVGEGLGWTGEVEDGWFETLWGNKLFSYTVAFIYHTGYTRLCTAVLLGCPGLSHNYTG